MPVNYFILIMRWSAIRIAASPAGFVSGNVPTRSTVMTIGLKRMTADDTKCVNCPSLPSPCARPGP